MNALEENLTACFAAVFPDRSREEIASATRESIPEWDSLASITLLTLVQQEFHIDIDLFELDEIGSFPALSDYLRRHTTFDGGQSGG